VSPPPRYVLDTNVVSELMRPVPAAAVLAWIGAVKLSVLATTAITVMEIRFGIARLPAGRHRESLDQRFAAFLMQGFRGATLPFDQAAAEAASGIRVARRRAGEPISLEDAMIGGIARAGGLAVVTRDSAGFAGCGVEVIDPWSAPPPRP
jgi:predicted nucleic acid-binding protein